ncbi:MAG: hypothetical protein RX318_11970 [bacterium]|nr:hypothetical protein [bacterium]
MRFFGLSLILIFIVTHPASAQVEKWVDKEGTIHLGSEPAPARPDGPHSPRQGVLPPRSSSKAREAVLQKELAYLKSIPEVRWVVFDGNNVYLGLRSLPGDIKIIVGAAAYHGNRAISFGVHVWAVDSKFRESPSDGYICYATARYGKVRKNSC